MNIIPISSNSSITPLQSLFAPEKSGGETAFKGMFSDAVDNLEQLNSAKGQDAVALSTSNIDDIAAMQINSQKAEVSLQMLVQMRNKVLDSYQEIMRINI